MCSRRKPAAQVPCTTPLKNPKAPLKWKLPKQASLREWASEGSRGFPVRLASSVDKWAFQLQASLLQTFLSKPPVAVESETLQAENVSLQALSEGLGPLKEKKSRRKVAKKQGNKRQEGKP